MGGDQSVTQRSMRGKVLTRRAIDSKIPPQRLILMVRCLGKDGTGEEHRAKRGAGNRRSDEREIESGAVRGHDPSAAEPAGIAQRRLNDRRIGDHLVVNAVNGGRGGRNRDARIYERRPSPRNPIAVRRGAQAISTTRSFRGRNPVVSTSMTQYRSCSMPQEYRRQVPPGWHYRIGCTANGRPERNAADRECRSNPRGTLTLDSTTASAYPACNCLPQRDYSGSRR